MVAKIRASTEVVNTLRMSSVSSQELGNLFGPSSSETAAMAIAMSEKLGLGGNLEVMGGEQPALLSASALTHSQGRQWHRPLAAYQWGLREGHSTLGVTRGLGANLSPPDSFAQRCLW